jgi:hypothetical protein
VEGKKEELGIKTPSAHQSSPFDSFSLSLSFKIYTPNKTG